MFKGAWISGWLGGRDPLETTLGHLERDVMDVVWRGSDLSVREVQGHLPRTVAYTTVMTTLDRLFKKGFVSRKREGRAYLYTAARSRDELAATVTSGLLRGMISSGPDAARPFLSNLVDAVGDGDAQLLDELERLVRDKQQQTKRGDR